MEERAFAVDFRLTRADLFWLRLVNGPFFWYMGMVLVIFLWVPREDILRVLSGQATAKEQSTLALFFLLGLLGCGAGVSLSLLLFWREAEKERQEEDEVVGKSTLAIMPSGLVWSNQQGTNSYSWSAAARVRVTWGYISLYFREAGALFIPRRAFNSPEDARRFLRATKTWLKAAATDDMLDGRTQQGED